MTHNPETAYGFIVKFKKEHDGNSPTIREIGIACDISSTSATVYVMRKLVCAGRITLWGTRGIVVTDGKYTVGEPCP